jgi:hypothetical protein
MWSSPVSRSRWSASRRRRGRVDGWGVRLLGGGAAVPRCARQAAPLAVVLDEVTYLTASTPGFASVVQSVWDRESAAGASHLMLALTGSSIGIERMLGGQVRYTGGRPWSCAWTRSTCPLRRSSSPAWSRRGSSRRMPPAAARRAAAGHAGPRPADPSLDARGVLRDGYSALRDRRPLPAVLVRGAVRGRPARRSWPGAGPCCAGRVRPGRAPWLDL